MWLTTLLQSSTCDVKFSEIEEIGLNFGHTELSKASSVKMFNNEEEWNESILISFICQECEEGGVERQIYTI